MYDAGRIMTALVLLKTRRRSVFRGTYICTIKLILFGVIAYQNNVEVTLIVPRGRQLQYIQASLGVGKPQYCPSVCSLENSLDFFDDLFVVSPNRFIISFCSHFDVLLVALQASLNDFEQFVSQK